MPHESDIEEPSARAQGERVASPGASARVDGPEGEVDGDEGTDKKPAFAKATADKARQESESEAVEPPANERTEGESSARDAEASEAETPEAETPEAETPEAETPEAETPEAETPEAETTEPETTEPEAPGIPLEEVTASVEALLYAAGDPLSLRELRKTLPEAPELVKPAIERLKETYNAEGRGLQLTEVAGGFQITTRPEFHERVSRLFETPRPPRLSIQALETLAVIAYRQPITVPEIMELRGVRSAGVVRTLLERHLVKILGHKAVVGRPLLYGTTKEFLMRFGLKNVKDLPQLKDMSEVFGDEVAQQLEVLDALGAPEHVKIEPLDRGEEERSSSADGGSDEAPTTEAASSVEGPTASSEDGASEDGAAEAEIQSTRDS